MGTIWQPSLSDFNGPKYKAVVAGLKTDIAKGILKSGDKLRQYVNLRGKFRSRPERWPEPIKTVLPKGFYRQQ